MKKLFKFLKDYKKQLILGPFFKLLEAVFELIVPIVMAKIIDVGIANSDSRYIYKMGGVLVILGVCGFGFALICQYFASQCAYGFGTKLRTALYKHINSLSYSGIDKIGTSSLTNRLINDTNTVQTGVNMFIRLGTRVPFLVLGAVIISMMTDIKLSLVFIIIAPIVSFSIFLVMRKTIPLYKKTQQKLDKATVLTSENIEGTRVIRAFSRQKESIKNFNNACGELAENAIIAGKISAILNPLTFMIMNIGIVFIIYFGGVRINNGHFTQGELTAFINYMTQILLALVVLANLIVTFTKAIAAGNRINEVFEISAEENDSKLNSIDDNLKCAIEFNNVSFKYNGASENSIENISFSIQNGETLGIIGGTGSGKTTICNLIPRFYNATSGEIKIFGRDIKSYDIDFLRKNIGVVSQKSVLFKGTIRDNMRWANENITDDEIIEALKISQAWEFVSKLPKGLDNLIEQGGRNLSGGQKQRLSIARAIAGNPKIIIFDDSTSALDYATDLKFRGMLTQKLVNTTVVMVSQRATTLQNADKIVVMDDGVAVGVGTHIDLLEKCDVYSEIYNSQLNNKGGV